MTEVAAMMDIELPIFSELHLKMAFDDKLGVVPRTAPLVIWEDSQQLPWSERGTGGLERRSGRAVTCWSRFRRAYICDQRADLAPRRCYLLWAYHLEPVEPVFPLPNDPEFPEIVLRGMSTLLPGLTAYLEKLPKSWVDGGYYTKTRENRPLIGPLPLDGAYILAALSGYGLMAACAGGELLAAHLCDTQLPDYAPAFLAQPICRPSLPTGLGELGFDGQL